MLAADTVKLISIQSTESELKGYYVLYNGFMSNQEPLCQETFTNTFLCVRTRLLLLPTVLDEL